jgi:two-component system sensor histidine kinase/response regulator
MPGLDGFQTVAHLRALDAPPAHIVMISSSGDESVAERARKEGLDGCLGKPISTSTLLDMIGTLLGRSAAPEVAPLRAGASDDESVLAQLRGHRVLLVEDNELNQIVASDLLSLAAGMQIDVAANGAEALERLRARHYDVVLMDVHMPQMDGYETTRRIRTRFSGDVLPVIAMTANATPRDREACLASGMNDFVTKPFEPARLFGVLGHWLSLRAVPMRDTVSDDAPTGGLSIELGLSYCLGRPELYEKIAQRYLLAWADVPGSMREALVKGHPEQLAFAAHSLVSSAGTIGAKALSELARALELSIEAGEHREWERLVNEIDDEGRVVSLALEAHLVSRGVQEAGPGADGNVPLT